MKLKFNLKAVIACAAVGSLFLFTNIDKKICEIFLANRKVNVDVENVLVVNGINSVESEFAGAREKIAESVLLLNEFGADKIIFDFDLSKKSTDNFFFDADAYLENCLKVKNNVFTSSAIAKGTGLNVDYKNVSQVDAAVIESIRDKFENSSSIDCDVLYAIKTKENLLVKIISELEDDGYFEYTPEYNSPYSASIDFIRKREILFEKLDSNDIEKLKLFEQYTEAKDHFFDAVLIYIESSAKDLISENADDRENTYGNIEQRFIELQKCFSDYQTAKENVQEKVNGSICVVAPDDIVFNIAAALFYFKSFVKTLWWWVGILISLVFCILCDFTCSFVKSLEKKICICVGFIYVSILISYAVFYYSGVYTGTIVCLIACIYMLVYEILNYKYADALSKFLQFANGTDLENKENEKPVESKNETVKAGKTTSIIDCVIEHYSEIADEFENEEDSSVLFDRYYDLILKTSESFGAKEVFRSNGKMSLLFESSDENEASVLACKAALKIKSVIQKLNAKLINQEILGKEIDIDVQIEMVI